jgi:hypothetical protein
MLFPTWLDDMLEIAAQGVMPALAVAAVVAAIWGLRRARRAV